VVVGLEVRFKVGLEVGLSVGFFEVPSVALEVGFWVETEVGVVGRPIGMRISTGADVVGDTVGGYVSKPPSLKSRSQSLKSKKAWSTMLPELPSTII
jgi:hypothetical protein